MTRFKGLTTHPSGCGLGHRTCPSEPCRARASALQLLQVPLITGGPGLFFPDTLLTPSFSFPSHWLGGDWPPVVRAPWAPHSVTKHLTAGHHLLACCPTHSWHCPAPSTGPPTGGPPNTQIQVEGKGLFRGPRSRGEEGWLVLLAGLGPLLCRSASVDTAGGFLPAALQGRGGEGRASPVHLGCPLLRGPAGPSGPQQQQLWPQRGQGEGKAPGRPRPTAPLPPGWPFQLATSSEWAGCGIPIILCRAGMWKPDPSPLVWWGWGGGHSTEVKGLEGHWTCEAGLQGGGGQPTHP